MVESAVSRLLDFEESVIYTGSAFEIPNKSIVGSHSLHFTNKGRVLAYDSGGMFGTERVVPFDTINPNYKLEMEFAGSMAIIRPIGNTTLSFNQYMGLDEFLEFYENIDRKTIFTYSGFADCLVKCNDRLSSGQCKIEKEHLIIDDKVLIPFAMVQSFELNKTKGTASLKGLFMNEDEVADTLELFFTDGKHYSRLATALEHGDSVYDLLPAGSRLVAVQVTEQDGLGANISLAATLAYHDGQYILLNEVSKESMTFLPGRDLFFYDCQYEKLLIVSEKTHIVTFESIREHSTDTILGRSQIKQDSGLLYSSIGNITGLFSGEDYSNETISLFYHNECMHFLSEQSLAITDGIPLDEANTFFLEDQYFIVHQNSILVLHELAEESIMNSLFANCCEDESIHQKIGFFDDKTPFILKSDDDGVYFFQDDEVQFKIASSQITNVSVIEQPEGSLFSKVLFQFKENQQDVELEVFIPGFRVKDILYYAFMKKKLPQLADVRPKQLFASWSRQANDFILYHYLGQLFVIRSGIEQIQQEDSAKEVKNIKLINLLYYGLQSQRQMMDKASVYLPAMLEKEQEELFRKIDGLHDPSPYKFMQRQLVGSSSQMARHISEIQSSLNAVSFAIIPKKEMENFARNRALRNGGMAIVASLISLPFGIFMGANAIFSFFDSKKQEQIRKENEDLKIDFYVEKALDAFDHFMDTMMPYYLTEVNEQLFTSFKQVAASYEPFLENRIVNESLLSRIAEIQAYKQMPIDETVLTKKAELVEEVQNNLSLAELPVRQFENEVRIDVQKSLQYK